MKIQITEKKCFVEAWIKERILAGKVLSEYDCSFVKKLIVTGENTQFINDIYPQDYNCGNQFCYS